MSSASEKRWAIMPPPSPTSAKVGTEMEVEEVAESGPREHATWPPAPGMSDVRELGPEPASSERPTESPPMPQARVSDPEFDTIPAPAWIDHDD